MLPRMPHRILHLIVDAATIACTAISLLGFLHFLLPRSAAGLTPSEHILFWLLGWLPELLFRGGPLLVSAPAKVTLAILVGLCFPRATRKLAFDAFSVLIASLALIATGLVCILTRTLAPAVSTVLSLASLAIALTLARQRSVSIPVLTLFSAAAFCGLFGSRAVLSLQMTSLVTHPVSRWVQVAPLALSTLIALAALHRAKNLTWQATPRNQTIRAWALITLGIYAVFVTFLDLNLSRAWTGPTIPRILEEFSYDLAVVGEPPTLVWSNRKWVQAIRDVYGSAASRHVLDDLAGFSERIFTAPGDTFDILNHRSVGRWDGTLPSAGGAAPRFAWLPVMPWFKEAGPACGYADDPQTGRYLILSEWYAQYAVVDRATGMGIKVGPVSNSVWPWPFATAYPAGRVAYLSSPISDGHLNEFNLDTLEITRRVPNLYLYETIVEPAASLLWGTRPVTGDLVAIDTRSLTVRHRIPVEASIRDVKLDPKTGSLYTCSFWSGTIYRASREDDRPIPIGWCGRFCRNLFLDTQRRTLWIATAEGICRLSLADRGPEALGKTKGGG